MMHRSIDDSAELLDAIHKLDAGARKAEQAAQAAAARGGALMVEMLETEAHRLRRELAHFRRLYAAAVAQHLRC
jgi:hypothetical protein